MTDSIPPSSKQSRRRLPAWLRVWRPVVIIAVVSTLLAAEIVLALTRIDTWPPVRMEIDRSNRNCFRPVPDSSIRFHENGLMGKITEHRVNSLGFRGSVPAKDVFRVAVVGGSAVYGVGIDENRTFPAMLEQALKKKFPDTKLSVMNLGFPGFNIEEQSREYQVLIPDIGPDIVLLAVTGDYSARSACSAAGLPVRLALRKISALWKYFENSTLLSRTNTVSGFSVPVEEYYMKIVLKRFRHNGTKSYLVPLIEIPPVYRGDGTKIPFEKVAGQTGFEILDLTEITKGNPLSESIIETAAKSTADILAPVMTDAIYPKNRQGPAR